MTHVTVRIQLDTNAPPDQAGASVQVCDETGHSYAASVTHDRRSGSWIARDENATADHPSFALAFDTLMQWAAASLREDLDPPD